MQPHLEYACEIWDPYLAKDIFSDGRITHLDLRWYKIYFSWKKIFKLEAEFKAKEASVLYSKSFVALKSSKPLTDVNNFVLLSEVHHEQRAMCEVEKQKRKQMREQENMERQALQAAEDAKIPCFKALVHKAQPVLQSAPIKIEPSDTRSQYQRLLCFIVMLT